MFCSITHTLLYHSNRSRIRTWGCGCLVSASGARAAGKKGSERGVGMGRHGRLGRESQGTSPSSQPRLQLCPGSGGLRAVLSVKAKGELRTAGPRQSSQSRSHRPAPPQGLASAGSAGILGAALLSGLSAPSHGWLSCLQTSQICLLSPQLLTLP